MAKNKKSTVTLQQSVARIMMVHFGFVLSFALATIIFDTWNLITLEGIKKRWMYAGLVLIVNILTWFLSRMKFKSDTPYKLLVAALAVTDIVFTGLVVGSERGMASKSVVMYVVPIVMMASLRSRRAIFATAGVAAASYVMAITKYFTEHYGEGFKVELYGVAFFYSALLFVVAGLLWASLSPKD